VLQASGTGDRRQCLPVVVQGAAEITPTFGGFTARAVEGVQ
jgi:hypothetical protein